MRLHFLGFLYGVRHAYQKDHDILVVDNGLSLSKRNLWNR